MKLFAISVVHYRVF